MNGHLLSVMAVPLLLPVVAGTAQPPAAMKGLMALNCQATQAKDDDLAVVIVAALLGTAGKNAAAAAAGQLTTPQGSLNLEVGCVQLAGWFFLVELEREFRKTSQRLLLLLPRVRLLQVY